jgi:hypothetical protein
MPDATGSLRNSGDLRSHLGSPHEREEDVMGPVELYAAIVGIAVLALILHARVVEAKSGGDLPR